MNMKDSLTVGLKTSHCVHYTNFRWISRIKYLNKNWNSSHTWFLATCNSV